MMRLKAKNQPFGRHTYKHPVTGVEITTNDFEFLVDAVKRHNQANGIPIGLGLEDELEAWACAQRPEACVDNDPNKPRPRRLSMADVLRGTKVMAHFISEGSPTVELEEAKRRAAICATCKFNITFSRPCSGLCGELRGIVQAIVRGRPTGYEDELKSCSICACYTSASVWLPLEIQCVGVNDEMRKQFSTISTCWKQCSKE